MLHLNKTNFPINIGRLFYRHDSNLFEINKCYISRRKRNENLQIPTWFETRGKWARERFMPLILTSPVRTGRINKLWDLLSELRLKEKFSLSWLEMSRGWLQKELESLIKIYIKNRRTGHAVRSFTHVVAHINTYTHTHTCHVRTHTCPHIHTHTFSCIHVYTHTQTCARVRTSDYIWTVWQNLSHKYKSLYRNILVHICWYLRVHHQMFFTDTYIKFVYLYKISVIKYNKIHIFIFYIKFSQQILLLTL